MDADQDNLGPLFASSRLSGIDEVGRSKEGCTIGFTQGAVAGGAETVKAGSTAG